MLNLSCVLLENKDFIIINNLIASKDLYTSKNLFASQDLFASKDDSKACN